MSKLEELKNELESIESTYDYDGYYTQLRNAVIDYENESQDWDLDGFFEEYVDYEIAEEIAKHELETGGLIRLYYFMGDANFNNEIFRIDGYGNLTNVDKDDLDCLKDDLLDAVNDKLKEDED